MKVSIGTKDFDVESIKKTLATLPTPESGFNLADGVVIDNVPLFLSSHIKMLEGDANDFEKQKYYHRIVTYIAKVEMIKK